MQNAKRSWLQYDEKSPASYALQSTKTCVINLMSPRGIDGYVPKWRSFWDGGVGSSAIISVVYARKLKHQPPAQRAGIERRQGSWF